MANKMTANVLMEIRRFEGSRCCKRDSMIAVETAKPSFEGFDNNDLKRSREVGVKI